MTKSFDPTRLDVAVFAKQAGQLQGDWALTRLPRLAETAVDPQDATPVRWAAEGEAVRRSGHPDELWLALRAEADVNLVCQRCLQTMPLRLAFDTRIRFVPGEDVAAQLDAESEEDVLALSRALDLRELVEDELLMALPIVPRHDACLNDLHGRAVVAANDNAERKTNPFAALRQLLPDSGDA